jgi:hypothetical protein
MELTIKGTEPDRVDPVRAAIVRCKPDRHGPALKMLWNFGVRLREWS